MGDLRTAVAALFAAFVGVGGVGLYGYLDNYWIYRGFAPPLDPRYVIVRGTALSLAVNSPALGGRRQQLIVYLPPGYRSHPRRRYPVLYLLHGEPGRPAAFLDTVRLGVVEDELMVLRRGEPLILVMPFGSTGAFTDKEWANGIAPHEGWETFVARDVVGFVDRRFRTVRAQWARGIGGLSEGGYGAINIAIHHPREFGLVESWSGYESADRIRSIFGDRPALLRANSPLLTLPEAAPALRAHGVFFWVYTGRDDPLRRENVAFAHLLGRLHVAHHFSVLNGGHNWALWRGSAANAYLAASKHLVRGT